jgi:hypothetical protein
VCIISLTPVFPLQERSDTTVASYELSFEEKLSRKKHAQNRPLVDPKEYWNRLIGLDEYNQSFNKLNLIGETPEEL